jgi:hypothetical protein
MKFARLFLPILALIALPAWADIAYQVTIDTSSVTGVSGFLDMEYNGGFPSTASVSNFTADPATTLSPAGITTQGAVGTLPGLVTMNNNNTDYDEGLTFGNSISFGLDFQGTPGGTVGDVFTLSFFNSDFSGGLLTGNNNDFWLAQFELDTQGNITAVAYPNPSGGPSFATITEVTPEPGTYIPAIAGVLGLIAWQRKRLNSRR